jgi:hypothetical protein
LLGLYAFEYRSNLLITAVITADGNAFATEPSHLLRGLLDGARKVCGRNTLFDGSAGDIDRRTGFS